MNANFYLMQTFADLVRRTRIERGWSQRELARRIGKSATYIHYVERGVNPSSRDEQLQVGKDAVDRIAKALEIPLDDARLAAGYAPRSTYAKPQNPAEFVAALERMGFEMQFSGELAELGPDDLQDRSARRHICKAAV